MDDKFRRKLQLGYGFSFLMLLVIGLLSFLYLRNLQAGNRAVIHSSEVILKLEQTLSLMKDAETGQRGYLLTNNPQFLEPYRGAYRQAMVLLNKTQRLTNDNPIQRNNLNAIRQIMQQRMTILKVLIDQRLKGQTVAKADLENSKAAMDALRLAVDRAEQEEQLLLSRRNIVLAEYYSWTPILISGAVLLSLLIAALSYLNVMRDVQDKEKLRQQLGEKEQETAAFNEELAAANEEIMAANEELTAINEELIEAREELSTANELLEEKVLLRTKALQESEEETQALNEELTAINEELAAANEEYQATNEELIRTRDLIAKSEKLFRAIAQHIPGSMVMVIGHDHHVLTLEGDLLEKLHYNSVEYEGKHLAEVTSPERYAASLDLYDRVLSGEVFRIGRTGNNGEVYQVDFVPLKDEKDDVYAGMIVVLDITELKQAEERSAKLAAIVASSDDAIISKTLDGIITSWNKAAERLFGYHEQEMIGQPILRLIPEDRQEEEPSIISRLRNGERVDHFETKRLSNDGKLIDVSLTISPVLDNEGKVIGISKIARDISEQKRDEQRKNDFIGMVSHELKTPLTTLTALIQVLEQKLRNHEDAFVPPALSKSTVQIRKMTTMINGFLNMTRLESGKIQIEKQKFNLDELITEMVDEARLTVPGHTIVFETSGPLQILADRDKIGSVISNLLSNSFKYSPKETTVTIRCEIIDGYVRVSVKDEGIGINNEDLEKLFQRYYRVSSNNTRHISGFGIGLYLSAEIIERQQGRIWAESTEGVGSTFYFTLPLN